MAKKKSNDNTATKAKDSTDYLAWENLSADELLQKLEDSKRVVTIDGEDLYVVEGDMVLDHDQLEAYVQERVVLAQEQKAARKAESAGFGLTGILLPPARELVGMKQGGRIVRWSPGTILSYCVLSQTFLNPGEYETVRDSMTRATADWENVCGVQFEYKQELDVSESVTPQGVLFTVRCLDVGGRFIASAFFPTDPRPRRSIKIDPSFFDVNLGFDRVGVLRHELGHVLGCRHEHIRSGAPAGCENDEDVYGIVPLTAYDPYSVMHYFCGGLGSRDLAITDSDARGAQRLYGPPLNSFRLIRS